MLGKDKWILLVGVGIIFTWSLNVWGEKVKLNYWSQDQVSHEYMVAQFEAQHPNISITKSEYPADKLRTILRTALAAGTGPDIVYFELGLGHIEPIIKANLFIDLEEAAKKYGWKERITPFALDEATHQGKLWAVPNEAELIVMYYNKRIFKELGVEIPTSWNALIDICKKSEAAGYDPIALGVAEKWPALHRISLGYQWGGGREAVKKALFEGAPWDTPQFIQGLKWVLKLDKNYMPNALGKTWAEGNAMFLGGKAVMHHTGTWFTEDIINQAPNPDDFDMFLPVPPGTKKPSSIAGCGSGWYVTSLCKNVDAALLFLDYATADEVTKIWIERNGCIPVIPYRISSAKVSPLLAKAIDFMSKYEMGYFVHHFVSADQVQWIRDGYQEMLAGKITPAQFAQKFEELAREAKKEGFSP